VVLEETAAAHEKTNLSTPTRERLDANGDEADPYERFLTGWDRNNMNYVKRIVSASPRQERNTQRIWRRCERD